MAVLGYCYGGYGGSKGAHHRCSAEFSFVRVSCAGNVCRSFQLYTQLSRDTRLTIYDRSCYRIVALCGCAGLGGGGCAGRLGVGQRGGGGWARR